MKMERRGLTTEKRSWKLTKLPANTVNSLVSITHLKHKEEEEGEEEGKGRGGVGGGGVHMDKFKSMPVSHPGRRQQKRTEAAARG